MNTGTPKEWSITTLSDEKGGLSVQRQGTEFAGLRFDKDLTPVELLLISVGNCLALSCHMAFTARSLALRPFAIQVMGRKATDAPSRLALIDAKIRFEPGLTAEQSAAIAAHAKRLCTVSNTLLVPPTCTVQVI